jgi:hypothetical protein
LDKQKDNPTTVRINADTYALDELTVRRIKNALTENHGKHPVEIVLNGGKTIRLSEEFNVNPNGLDVTFDFRFGDAIKIETINKGDK